MNAKQKVGLLIFAGIVVAVSYWTGYVHGSSSLGAKEMVFSVVFPVILIWTLAKLTIAFVFRRGTMPPPSGGSQPPLTGVPIPKPPGAPPEIRCQHAA